MNATHRRFLYWDGRIAGADLPTLVRDHVSEHHFMAADGRLVIERLRQIPEYADRFRQAFGSDVSYGKILNAVAAFVRTLNSHGAALDRYLAGDRRALSPSAARGLELFQGKAACSRCHSGPLLSDGAFHRAGVPENRDIFVDPERHITFRRFMRTLGADDPRSLRQDLGRYAVTKQANDRRRFLTPSLRELVQTAPYMHNGVFATLEAVVDFYDHGGGPGAEGLKPLGLTADERSDLVAFLRDGLAGRLPDPSEPEMPAYGVLALPGVRVTAGGVR
jgi:cytochrome c peroxidase